MTRFVSTLIGLIALGVSVPAARQDVGPSPYAGAVRLPSVVNGQALHSFVHDPVTNRLYAANQQGLYWVDLADPDPRVKGPLINKRLTSIEVAPDTGRLFYATLDEVGMVNLRTNDPPVRLAGREWPSARFAYEPTRRQMYLATRTGRVLVFDAETGEQSPDVIVPGEYANMLEAIPGRVFFTLADKSGLFVIDAATKAVTPWAVTGKLVTPVYLDADPTGKYLFATYDRYVLAIDVARATVVGRLITATGGRIAFDSERRLLIASQYKNIGLPQLRLAAYRVDDDGFTEVARLKILPDAAPGLESLRGGGFLQSGHKALFVWKLAETR
jgi:DNA-binding beta-propeller fold protein YncE